MALIYVFIIQISRVSPQKAHQFRAFWRPVTSPVRHRPRNSWLVYVTRTTRAVRLALTSQGRSGSEQRRHADYSRQTRFWP